MASDEELARRVARLEDGGDGGVAAESSAGEELDEYKAVAGEIHDELARRIERVDDATPDEGSLEDAVERLDRLEDRLDALERRL